MTAPGKYSISPSAKHKGQESGGELCEMFKLAYRFHRNNYNLIDIIRKF